MSTVGKTTSSEESWVHLKDTADDVGTVVEEQDLQKKRDLVITVELGELDQRTNAAAASVLASDQSSDGGTTTASEKDPPPSPSMHEINKIEKGSGCCDALRRCIKSCWPSFSRTK